MQIGEALRTVLVAPLKLPLPDAGEEDRPMNILDVVSPVVGYRTWRWDNFGLQSINRERWIPGQYIAAQCGASNLAFHSSPEEECSCGIYAAKTFQDLVKLGYGDYEVFGEVHLWGFVVEHRLGYRGQFAYPKALVVSIDALPFALADASARLENLASYGTDIFVRGTEGRVRVWAKDSGLDEIGLDCLVGSRKKCYEQRFREKRPKRGNRVALVGRGIGIVQEMDGEQICVTLGRQLTFSFQLKDLDWNERNRRWESKPGMELQATRSTPNPKQGPLVLRDADPICHRLGLQLEIGKNDCAEQC
jgi:hypothetical protein